MTKGETAKDTKLYSTRDVAERLGLRRYQVDYLLETGRILEPALRVAGKRIWCAEELQAAAEWLRETKTESVRGATEAPTGNGEQQRAR